MKRAIIEPAVPAPEALAELKQWLAIATSREDPALERLVAAALEVFETFTGSLALEATCEEVLPAGGAWQCLATRPVLAVLGVDALAADGTRTPLPADGHLLELDAEGGARIRVLRPLSSGRIAVRFVAGLAASWSGLPDSLRHGVIRCAAHLHAAAASSAEATPPAAVAALWRPWRRLRLT